MLRVTLIIWAAIINWLSDYGTLCKAVCYVLLLCDSMCCTKTNWVVKDLDWGKWWILCDMVELCAWELICVMEVLPRSVKDLTLCAIELSFTVRPHAWWNGPNLVSYGVSTLMLGCVIWWTVCMGMSMFEMTFLNCFVTISASYTSCIVWVKCTTSAECKNNLFE